MRALILIPVLALLTGCYSQDNLRLTVAKTVALSAIDPSAEESYLDSPTGEPLNLKRTNWETYTFLVPVDGTDHHYIGRMDRPCTDKTARQRDELPTVESAVELGGDSGQTQAYEALEAPFWAAGDALLLIPRLIGWEIANRRAAVSPDISYQRYPTGSLTPEQRRLWLGE